VRFRWGIVGTGNIAASMAQALALVDTAELVAVGSREHATAVAFGERWGIPRCYGSYAALAADPEVDIAYIATPNSLHCENMKLFLQAGKHVLCEKPLALDARQAAECITLARRKGLFLMEAVWMRFFPAMTRLRQWVAEEAVGEVQLVQAEACLDLPTSPAHRVRNPQLGGGALLDLGIYPFSLATMLLGFPQQVESLHTRLTDTGVDALDVLRLSYGSGALALLSCSLELSRPCEALIMGTRGYIKIHDSFLQPRRLTLRADQRPVEVVDLPFVGNGYAHEVNEVHACLATGKLESDRMPLNESQRTLEAMDTLRSQWGVVYPTEPAEAG
jgi:predicted dehydrogenase